MRNAGGGRPFNGIVRRPRAMNDGNEIAKQLRDLNDRAAAFHAQAEADHAKDRFAQIYYKVFFVGFIAAGVGVLFGAIGLSFALPVFFLVVAGCVLVGGVLVVTIIVRNVSQSAKSLSQARRIEK
jgi:hypothetical protein